jgi:ABC-2 type transport system permease protein
MTTLALGLRQARYEMLAFWRNPAAAFFTFVFPLMFLFIFNSIFGSDRDIPVPGGSVDTSTFYVPAILAFSVISATYTNISMTIVYSRDEGLLKRLRGTPLPAMSYFIGRILQAIGVTLLLVVIVLAAGILLYGVELEAEKVPWLIVVLVAGSACFCALGLAITGFVPNADAAPAVINASILPLLFISNVFIPTSNAPDWMNDLASLFPVSHFANGLIAAFNPFESGSGFDAKSLAVLIAWGVAGTLIAMRYFSWEPRK